MYIVHVYIRVKDRFLEAFKKIVADNARASLNEPGIVRFDVLQQKDEPTRFVLMEVYQTPDDLAKHKESEHYKKWREEVADMVAEPRLSIKYNNLFPGDSAW